MGKRLKVGECAGLEVFDSDRKLMVTHTEISEAARDAETDTFLRRVRFSKAPELPLRAFLDWGSEQFVKIAQLTGGVALDPKWGLYDLGHNPDGMYLASAWCQGMPPNHVLAAEVPVIDQCEVESDALQRWRRGCSQYLAQPEQRLGDINPSNFTPGIIRSLSTSCEPASYILHDVELWPTSPQTKI